MPPRELEEQRWSEWMARANRGDAQAYRDLMGEVAEAVEAFVRSQLGGSDFVEDCVQESLLAVHRARATYDPGRPFRPWLFTIVRHKTIDLLRRRGVRERERGTEPDQLAAVADPASADPTAGLEAGALLGRLEPEQREALALTKLAGYSLAEAAERAGVSQSAMKTRVHRALRAARRILEREGSES